MAARIVILTGASGSGKTAIAEAIRTALGSSTLVHHFESIGVPTAAEMVAGFGSPEGWQRAMTQKWIGRLATAATNARAKVLLEGQMRVSFITEAARRAALPCQILLADCDDATRARRLAIDRGQPELANPEMMAWATFLRNEAMAAAVPVIDTSEMSLAESAAAVSRYLSA